MSFKKSTKRGYRYQTQAGVLTTESLWGLNKVQIEALEQDLIGELAAIKKPGRFAKVSANTDELKIKLNVVSSIIDEIIEDDKKEIRAEKDRKFNAKLDRAIAKAEDEEIEDKFAGKTPEELKRMRK